MLQTRQYVTGMDDCQPYFKCQVLQKVLVLVQAIIPAVQCQSVC